MNIILVFLVAISLSMDAFSLSLAYGTIKFTKKDRNLLSIIVGAYHFFMPILGMLFGNYLLSIFHIDTNLIIFIIFSFVGINMLIDSFKKNKIVKKMKVMEMLLFGLAVSIDSFSTGIGMNAINSNFLMCSFIFSITSAFFTYVGILLGTKINLLIGKISTFIGGFTLIVLGLLMFIFN